MHDRLRRRERLGEELRLLDDLEVFLRRDGLDVAEPEARERQPEVQATPAQPDFKIIKKSKFFTQPLTPSEAVMQMNLLNNDFLVFTNASSHEVNVVYRRGDGTYGLIETGHGASA